MYDKEGKVYNNMITGVRGIDGLRFISPIKTQVMNLGLSNGLIARSM
jgi:hypothetical protein